MTLKPQPKTWDIDNGGKPQSSLHNRENELKKQELILRTHEYTRLEISNQLGMRVASFETPLKTHLICITVSPIAHEENEHIDHGLQRDGWEPKAMNISTFSGIEFCSLLAPNIRTILERKLADADASEEDQNNLLKFLEKKETEYMRQQRHKMWANDFEFLTMIGKGAFGEADNGIDVVDNRQTEQAEQWISQRKRNQGQEKN
ncbi:hypothetical protein Syun_003740 [Stephania yunnanensis]|uniref:Uncharacterized protein n=1 Tax=Stephania yunnanensis TaxID=152371 RepID=A0AAP0L1Q2_9MAGN